MIDCNLNLYKKIEDTKSLRTRIALGVELIEVMVT